MSTSSIRKFKVDYSGDSLRNKILNAKRGITKKDSKRKLSRNRYYTPMGRSFPSTCNMKFTFNKVY